MCMAFTSCDTDRYRSMELSGQWRGDFGMYYEYEYRGRIYTFDSYDTDIVFYPDYEFATHGWGKQVDYYEFGPYEYMYYQFDWRIINGEIQLSYPYDPELNTRIHNYRLTNSYFSGYFVNSTEPFRLYKITDFYDWGPYTNTYGYGMRYGWSWGGYYANTRSVSQQDSDSTISIMPDSTTTGEGRIISRGNRFE